MSSLSLSTISSQLSYSHSSSIKNTDPLILPDLIKHKGMAGSDDLQALKTGPDVTLFGCFE
jgi:hypothetical protein